MKNKKVISLLAIGMMMFPCLTSTVIAEEINKTDIVVKSSYPDNKEAAFIEEYIDKMLTLTDLSSNYEAGSGFGKMVEDKNLSTFDSVGYINWAVYQTTGGGTILSNRNALVSDFTNSAYFREGDWDSIKTDAIIGDVIISNDNSLFSVYVGKNSAKEPIFLTSVGNPFIRETNTTSGINLVSLDDLGTIDGYYMLPEKLANGPLQYTMYSSDFDRQSLVRDFDDIISNQRTGYDVVDPATLK